MPQQRVAAKHLGELMTADVRFVEAQQALATSGDQQRRRTHRRGFDTRVARAMHLRHMPQPLLGIAGQLAHEAVVESKVSHWDSLISSAARIEGVAHHVGEQVGCSTSTNMNTKAAASGGLGEFIRRFYPLQY